MLDPQFLSLRPSGQRIFDPLGATDLQNYTTRMWVNVNRDPFGTSWQPSGTSQKIGLRKALPKIGHEAPEGSQCRPYGVLLEVVLVSF